MFATPIDYNDANAFTILTTKKVLKKFFKYIRFGENDLILDVGSGSGNVTTEVLIPALPKTNFQLVGVDISEKAVEYANKNYNNPKVAFRVVDMVEKDEQVLKSAFTKEELNPGFDLVFSFCVIQWTFDEEQCLRNIFTLMKPGGQALLWWLGNTMLTDLWQATMDKGDWRTYIKEPAATFKFHNSTDVTGDVTALLKRIGFEVIICDCVSRDCIHDINYNWRNILKIVDPHIKNVPEHLHSQYMDDVMSEFTRLYEKNNCFTHDRITVVATKPML